MHLSKRFGAFLAVDQSTVRIERGEIFGVLDSKRCGKTTTMKMLAGLLRLASRPGASFHPAPGTLGDLTHRAAVEVHGCRSVLAVL